MASESPVEEFVVRGRRVLVKRDDKVRVLWARAIACVPLGDCRPRGAFLVDSVRNQC